MIEILFSIIIACIIVLIFNKPLEQLSDNLADKSNKYIKNLKEKQKTNLKNQINQIKNITSDENTKLEPTFKNIIKFYLIIFFSVILLLGIGVNLGFEFVLLIITIFLIISAIHGIILSPYRGIILSILFIGGIIIFILLYIHRYDIMLFKTLDNLFLN